MLQNLKQSLEKSQKEIRNNYFAEKDETAKKALFQAIENMNKAISSLDFAIRIKEAKRKKNKINEVQKENQQKN